uniref:Uncharacterized protein n=1 Tax=Rhizophora mucronata TaxID=61149 RepID=A0A2P2PKK6_RHIMU
MTKARKFAVLTEQNTKLASRKFSDWYTGLVQLPSASFNSFSDTSKEIPNCCQVKSNKFI